MKKKGWKISIALILLFAITYALKIAENQTYFFTFFLGDWNNQLKSNNNLIFLESKYSTW